MILIASLLEFWVIKNPFTSRFCLCVKASLSCRVRIDSVCIFMRRDC